MKDTLRRHFRVLRDAIPGPRRLAAGAAVAEHLSSMPAWEKASTVLAYASFGSEVPTPLAIQAARAAGKRVALPRIEGAALVLHEALEGDSLVANRFGIPEPSLAAPVVPADRVDLVLVPGLAFDRRGGRLGYGGGYYDRMLRTASHAFRAALTYGVLVVDLLPTTLQDAPMDALVTESGVHPLPKRHH